MSKRFAIVTLTLGALAISIAIAARLPEAVALQAQPAAVDPGAATEASAAKMPEAALTPYVETHSHSDPASLSHPDALARAIAAEMTRQNAARVIILPLPWAANDPAAYDLEKIAPVVKLLPDKLAFLGGGGTLNPMIQEAVRSGDAGPEVQRKFKERAEEIIRQGAVGFGETTAEHFAFAPSQSYQYAPPDHPLFLILADVAAEHNVPIDLHMEAVPQAMPLPAGLIQPPNQSPLHANIAAFERLLAHNPRAKIMWAHGGWDNTGYRTPDLMRRLLEAHPNLYMEIKIDPLAPGLNSPLSGGKLKPEWLKLVQDFPDRFVVGSDQHYGLKPVSGPDRWQATIEMVNQLPSGLREKIASENALRLYSLARTQ
jgi:predicted TIM-barrel fold metal-dependent hydrolase